MTEPSPPDRRLQDEHAWLEEVEGDGALDWVRARNAVTEADLFVDPRFEPTRAFILEVLEADDRIPLPSRHLDSVLNFWTDAEHRRGLVRRTTWESYRAGEERWEVLLDVDALGAAEGESWVYHGGSTRRPDRRRTLLELSPGGSDTSVTREFDMVDKSFVTEADGGFVRPLSKGWLVWVDDDMVYVGHDFGEGTTTTSGYPRTVRRWERGKPLEDTPLVFEGEAADVSVAVSVDTLPGWRHHLFRRALDFYRSRKYVLRDGSLVELDVPEDADVSLRERWLLVRPRRDWEVPGQTHPAGSLVAAELEDYLAGARRLTAVFVPTATSALSQWAWTRGRLILTVQEDVRDHLETADPGDGWRRRPVAGSLPVWSVNAWPVDSDVSDDAFLMGQDFLHPTSLYLVPADGPPELLRSQPERFDSSAMTMQQRFATSADGTRVPYFLVGEEEGIEAGRPAPTILYGYGGFEISLTASYSGVIGRSWLAHGGRYVVANIR